MSTVTVTVVRDAESPEWWLAHFTFCGESYTTQGAIIDEARFMAADLLQLLGAGSDCLIEFVLQDRETLSAVLARPVTPSLIAEKEVEKPFAVMES